ncbi:LysR family transcriptional regulator [Erwinia phyllosphaerae]|uniref:LysR family transcriptional regulator n=1 Tax=Erwinia phyllosphaerae TaxID=2853256 RepID=UPI001FEFE4A1|nr:LysR family transcriptional regulator [Erwinia phyllosphaerae]MBV4366562.1 LysR family transcriptional regulator [Erwinia phyllosphaerae]
MDKLDELAVFVAVVQHGSLAAAARTLRRSPAAVTRTLAALEKRFGSLLIERTTRRLAPTPAGMTLFERAKKLLDEYQQALNAVTDNQLSGQLRLTAPVQFGRRHVAPLLLAFMEHYPDIQIELQLNDGYQDLIEQGLDMALRIGQLRDSSLVAVSVGSVQRLLVASPDYLTRMGTPGSPAALAHHSLIASISQAAGKEWRFSSAGVQERVRLTPRLIVNEVETQLLAARAGKGIARLLSYQVYDDLQTGSLCEILPDYRSTAVPVQLVRQNVKYMPARVRAFWDLALARLPELGCLQTNKPRKNKIQAN